MKNRMFRYGVYFQDVWESRLRKNRRHPPVAPINLKPSTSGWQKASGFRSLGFRNSIAPNHLRYAQEVVSAFVENAKASEQDAFMFALYSFSYGSSKRKRHKHLQTPLNVYIM